MKKDFDIVIVGAGVIGLLLCKLLEQRVPSLSIALIDASDGSEPYDALRFDSRVFAISPNSQALLSEVGLWQNIEALRVCPYQNMEVWDAEGTGNIEFECDDIFQDRLGHIVENSALISVLRDSIARSPAVTLIGGQKVERLHVDATLSSVTLDDGRELSAPLIVAADGSRSSLREWGQFRVREWDYGHDAIVTNVKTERGHGFVARQRFSIEGPLAFLPLSVDGRDDSYCSIVWSLARDSAKDIVSLSDQAFCEHLSQAIEFRLGRVLEASERHSFPLYQRHATQYYSNGLVLVGDAAHTIHPLAGQGANLGFYDVDVLSQEIARGINRGLPLSEVSILKRYQRRRQGHNLLAMTAMEGFKRLFGSDKLPLRWARNEGLRIVDRQSWLKKHLAKLASGQQNLFRH